MALRRFSKPPTLITSLPDELIVDIIARLPLSNYPIISLISRRFRSIVVSPELYRRRSSLRLTEHCLYALLYNPKTRDYRWYIRRRSNGFVLIPSLPPMPAHGSFVAVGSKIYVLGGVYSSGVNSNLFTIDCTTHTVQTISNTPKPMAMSDTVAGTIDGKIYVIGLSELSKGIMVFNTKTGIWEAEMIKLGFEIGRLWPGCVVMEGGTKIYMRDRENSFVYGPKEDKWEIKEMLNTKGWEYACLLDDVLYYYDFSKKKLRAYDTKLECWSEVKGVGRLLPGPRSRPRWSYIVSWGGKLAVFLPKEDNKKNKTEIWCFEISLERRQGGEVSGKVEWGGVVIDGDYFFVRCLSITV